MPVPPYLSRVYPSIEHPVPALLQKESKSFASYIALSPKIVCELRTMTASIYGVKAIATLFKLLYKIII